MTMMTSLKALLFPTAAGPAGVGAAPVAADGSPDFAALLDGVTGDAAPSLPNAVPNQAAPDASPDVATVPTATILTTKTGLAATIAVAEDASEPITQDATPVTSSKAVTPQIKPEIAAATLRLVTPDELEASAATEEEVGERGEQSDDKPGEPVNDVPSADMLVPSMPVVVPPIAVAAPAAGSSPAPVSADPDAVATSPAPSQVVSGVSEQAVLAPEPRRAESAQAVKPDMPSGKILPQVPITSSDTAAPPPKSQQAKAATGTIPDLPSGKTVPQVPIAPADKISKSQPPAAGMVQALPDSVSVAKPATMTSPSSDAAIAQSANGATGADATKVVPPLAAQQAVPRGAAMPSASITVPTPAIGDPMIAVNLPADAKPIDATDAPVITDAATPQPKAAHAAAPRVEAVSLLQFVRDHLSARSTPREAAPAAKATETNAAPTIDASAAASAPAPILSTAAPALPIAAPTVIAPTAPDLSASLGAQVVDMGVQGQWIDGLARDIAGLSANGAQGRFQIDTQQLGPVQVAIRQDGDGAAVSLTVATKAAEDALRQDSDRLRLDAGLQAIRINEVKIERAPHVAEAARSDTQNQQQSSQHNGQQSQQSAWQASGQQLGQNANQSAQQGRWQGRENFSGSHKAGADASVITHADAGESARDGPRARYA